MFNPGETLIHAPEFIDMLLKYPNLVAWLNGHTHINTIQAHSKPNGPGGFFEITTASCIDYPQQAQTVELVDNKDGTMSIFCVTLDHASPATWTPGDFSQIGLASLSRELSSNDWSATPDAATRLAAGPQRGTAAAAPFDLSKITDAALETEFATRKAQLAASAGVPDEETRPHRRCWSRRHRAGRLLADRHPEAGRRRQHQQRPDGHHRRGPREWHHFPERAGVPSPDGSHFTCSGKATDGRAVTSEADQVTVAEVPAQYKNQVPPDAAETDPRSSSRSMLAMPRSIRVWSSPSWIRTRGPNERPRHKDRRRPAGPGPRTQAVRVLGAHLRSGQDVAGTVPALIAIVVNTVVQAALVYWNAGIGLNAPFIISSIISAGVLVLCFALLARTSLQAVTGGSRYPTPSPKRRPSCRPSPCGRWS